MALKEEGNVLLLDEPTNDIDRITSYNVCYTKLLRVKYRKGRHDRVIEGNFGVFGPMIGEFAEIRFDGLD